MYSFIAVSNTSGNCSDGELRLEGGSDDIQAGTRQGRVEICINNAWGTICDNLFRRQDAKVVCGRLEGFQRDGEHCVTMARSVECKFAKATKVGLLAVFLYLHHSNWASLCDPDFRNSVACYYIV